MDTHQEQPADKPTLAVSLTTHEDSDLPVYLAGNFNGWKLSDDRYRMNKKGEGYYFFEFSNRHALPPLLEYKYNRGTWETVELDTGGQERHNRLAPATQHRIKDTVPKWKQGMLEYNPAFLPSIQIISEAFEIPQLIRTRRIAVLLPHDYAQSERRYPVLYLQDGQNLFDDFAPFGSWAVDKKLAKLAEKSQHEVIIVSIDHAAEDRIAEFTPSYTTRLGRGDGMLYAGFLTETLKPYVDSQFRTLPGRQHTAIGGSSMGGLISIYAGLMYPHIYQKWMIFSPSLWVDPDILLHTNGFKHPHDLRVYLYGGGDEGPSMAPGLRNFAHSLKAEGKKAHIELMLSIDPKGRHNEARWGEEFPQAIKWLFFS
jgi:predicted alpha/beta superfamily hydrolase